MPVSDVFEKSILVTAHPDDEILWFSSLLGQVDHVLLCFLNELVNPEFGSLRQQALSRHPLRNKMSCLEVVALGASMTKGFLSPRFNQYGMELAHDNVVANQYKRQYKENYVALRGKLADILSGYQNVVTHNPWGEYGHEEHVQIYRVVKELQKSIGYNIWFSSYCSTRTVGLAARMLSATDIATLPTDRTVADDAMDLYKETGCWTWYEDWHWPAEETFLKRACFGRGTNLAPGTMLPLNMVVVPPLRPRPFGLRSMVRRIIKRSGGI
jgi:LmbE family N-acetylglucosaminyl deacetylase